MIDPKTPARRLLAWQSAMGDLIYRKQRAGVTRLVIHKLFAGRARDLEDVATVIRRQRTKVDWAYLEEWAQELRHCTLSPLVTAL
ncbi:MAG: hypothetical protein IIA27_03700 [Gemmatimonadetes bacterium]|nr:hypothetical protein [Gemmatimonadota bacterium]